MSEMIFKSDSEPRHRRWFNCIRIPFEYKYLISGEVEVLSQEQDLVFQSHEPLAVRDDEGRLENAYVLGMRAGTDADTRANFPLAIQFLATYGGGDSDITFRSYFPVYDDGAEVAVRITAVHEWGSGMEATLEGEVLDGSRNITFYDTRYASYKSFYKVGETYLFRLAGLAHCVEVLKNTKEKLSPQATEMMCQQLCKPIKRDSEGNVVPMSIDTKDMVAFVSRGGDYPDDYEFQSTVRGIGETSLRTDRHCVLRIACARGDDGREIEIPLVVNPDLLGRPYPKIGKCVRGILCLQGHCVQK